jgi:exocyst complex component 2
MNCADAKLFHHLEAWVANPSETYTVYLSLIEVFQRQVTTFAFKLAGGIELSSSVAKQTRQNPITPALVAKIVKAFIDAMYSFLDGFLFLATRETPTANATALNEKALVSQTSIMAATNRLELLDLDNKVKSLQFVSSSAFKFLVSFVPGHTVAARHVESRLSHPSARSNHDQPIRDCVYGHDR